MQTYTDPNWADLCCVQERRSSVSSLSPPCVLLSLLSAPPLIALFPLRYENPTGETISQDLWSSGLLSRCCSNKSFWLCQPSSKRRIATRRLSYLNTYRNAVHLSLCLETYKQAVFPLLLLQLIYGMQGNAKMHEGKSRLKHTRIHTCWD